MIIFLNNIFD